ncbi:MAG: 7TM diverse intracellular signaling domain-containing protein [Flavobacteriales bacterium]
MFSFLGRFLFLLSLLLAGSLHAEKELQFTRLSMYVDSTCKETVEEVNSPSYTGKFKEIPMGQNIPNVAINYWLKIEIENKGNSETEAYLRIPSGLAYDFEFYTDKNASISQIGFKHKSELTPNVALTLPPGKSLYIANFRGFGGAYHFDFALDKEEDFIDKAKKQEFAMGVFYGVLLLILLLNLFYWFTLKKAAFGHYSLFVLFAIGNYSCVDCIPFLGIFGELGSHNRQTILIALVGYCAYLPTFAMQFLQITDKYPRLYKWVVALFVFAIVSTGISFIFDSPAAFEFYYKYYNLTILAGVIMTILIVVKGLKERNILSRNFLIAAVILTISMFICWAESYGLTHFDIGWQVMKLGSAIEIIILSFTIGMNFRNVEMQYNKVQANYSDLEDSFLRTQMNPHFLFNIMGSIKNRIMKNDKDGAIELVDRFSSMVRNVVDTSKQEFIPLNTEINFLKDYIALQSRSLEGKFTFDLHIDERLNPADIAIPNMILQPFIENAFKHGLLPSKAPEAVLSLRIEQKDKNVLHCIITDNGIGFQSATSKNSKSVGMANTRERLDKLKKKYNKDFSFQISALKTGTGTRVEIDLPVEAE